MSKMMNTCYRILAILSIIAISASCTAAPPATNPASTVSNESLKLKVIDIVGIHEWTPQQESTLNCALEGQASSSNALKYSWSAEQGTISGEGKEVKWAAPETPGDYKITVQVSDEDGDNAAFSKSFKVTTNPYNNDTPDETIYLNMSLPSATIIEAKSRMRILTTREIECKVDGANTSELTYTWTAPTGKLMGNGLKEGKASRIGWISPGQAGDYKVSVTVTDAKGNSASGEVNFDIYCCRP